MKAITLELDDLDYDAVQKAIAVRQSFRVWPEDDDMPILSNVPGLAIAEICRGWLEFLEVSKRRKENKSNDSEIDRLKCDLICSRSLVLQIDRENEKLRAKQMIWTVAISAAWVAWFFCVALFLLVARS
jgi:hypothetical protein